MTALQNLLKNFQQNSQTNREQGTYFEELVIQYFKNEPYYQELYEEVLTYKEFAEEQNLNGNDAGIDLVAKIKNTNSNIDEFHAIQCKFYNQDYKIQKSDIDSFFTASGKKIFTQRIIISTTNNWSQNAEDALQDQHIPVLRIDFCDLENSKIDWAKYQPNQKVILKPKKDLRDHQKQALIAVEAGLKKADRGKLIMACGTGKTFTSLKIAEKLAGKGKRVLFLVPSLSLLSQSLTEWTQESTTPLNSFAVCSDADVGKKRQKDEERTETFIHELRYPATTNSSNLAKELQKFHNHNHMSVVFSTYHSIETISKAQKNHGLEDFDLIICDEAHRTTGQTFDNDDESQFVLVHNQDFIKAKKRLYMTATPRIYGNEAKAIAEKDKIEICSMDDELLYGKALFTINFSSAVAQKLLVDYKVIVLAVDSGCVSDRLQNLLKDENNALKVDDATRIIGCWKALSKQDLAENLNQDAKNMQRAVAFCQVIEPQNINSKTNKVSSKKISSMFAQVVEEYKKQESASDEMATQLICEAKHIDGSMNASQKQEKLDWLKAEIPENTCRILSNVRCLSEGVDVPSLDAVLFLTPRNSQVDVVQSVGRVMRNSPGKKYGYVILPVVIPSGMEANESLDKNQNYKVVWQVLNALRSHDDRFDAFINKLDLIGQDKSKMEVICITNKINDKKQPKPSDASQAKNSFKIGEAAQPKINQTFQTNFKFEVGEIERAIYAQIVKKCGNRNHWEDWANDISSIAQNHITRINSILKNPENLKEINAFAEFLNELRDDLNSQITESEAVEMLAQHLITKPVFEALFENYSFAKNNPVSKAMEGIVEILSGHHLQKEADTLQKFYDSVKQRAAGINDVTAKQKIIHELYENFFKKAFPKMKDRLGIVYTPVEVVDFIIHSVNDVLKAEFNQTLGSNNVHIIDPFTGTGTFITRLLQSGLISKEQLTHKYQHEIHANEIVLLAYYIAAINIESVYHDIMGNKEIANYQPFNGICLTDTFALYEKGDMISDIFADNSARRKRQKKLDIRVIIGNPPYSSGQRSENDNNANISYPKLDESIRQTYAKNSQATLQKNLYDSYIRSIRWATDRVKDAGVIGFVTNAGFFDSASADGLRKCLAEEFSSLYIFHLRGNQRTSGELSRKEGGKIFGSGSRAPIAITLLVKNPKAKENGKIYFYDIGDYLNREDKLSKINHLKSISGISNNNLWQEIVPDFHSDWINQRDHSFSNHISIGDKKDKSQATIFENYSLGVATNRDAWCYNFSKEELAKNMQNMIGFYNSELSRYKAVCDGLAKENLPDIGNFVSSDKTKISWTDSLKNDLARSSNLEYQQSHQIKSAYRPFTKQWLYYDKNFNQRRYQMPQIFPDASVENRVIHVAGNGARSGFSVLMANHLPDLQHLDNGQCFPLKLFSPKSNQEESEEKQQKKENQQEENQGRKPQEALPNQETPLFVEGLKQGNNRQDLKQDLKQNLKFEGNFEVKDGITEAGLLHFQDFYNDKKINKEDLFYYIYGLLHSKDYKQKFADNLTKELPRIPCVKKLADFWRFSQAGRELGELHIDYENVSPFAAAKFLIAGKSSSLSREGVVAFTSEACKLRDEEDSFFKVEKMKFAKVGKETDKSKIIYNHKITVENIPLEAYQYIVNGKSAIEWVMERQGVSIHKESGIKNDANLFATETMHNAKYPLELLLRVINVSLKTIKIVQSLPKLEI